MQRCCRIFFLKIKKSGLSQWIIKVCNEKQIKILTPLQQACIPSVLLGKDLMVFSTTGTGKTLAYMLPGIQMVDSGKNIGELTILIPTQELGFQVFDILTGFGKKRKLSSFFLYKKKNEKFFENLLIFNHEVRKCLVSTPKYFFIFLKKSNLLMSKKKVLAVIDEADFLLGKKFCSEIEVILMKYKPVQILLFSATVTKNLFVLKFPTIQKNSFCFYEKKTKFSFIKNLYHKYFFCPSHLKIFYVLALLVKKKKILRKNKKKNSKISIIFASSCEKCRIIGEKLKKHKISTVLLHEGMDHTTRLLTMQILKSDVSKTLICTDAGCRGLDFPSVDLVINFDFPKKISTYIHRVGRASRFHKTGNCLNLICQKEIHFLHFFEKKTGIEIKKSTTVKENEILKYLSKKYQEMITK